MYEKGVDKFEEELGVEKILHSIRSLKIRSKTMMTEKFAFEIAHAEENII